MFIIFVYLCNIQCAVMRHIPVTPQGALLALRLPFSISTIMPVYHIKLIAFLFWSWGIEKV